MTFRWSCGRAEQVGQPDEVVGGHRQSKLESQACDPAQHGPRETTNGLGPAERLLSALALALADRITRMARRASVDRRGSVGGVLCNVRRDVEVAQIVDELAHSRQGLRCPRRALAVLQSLPPAPRLA